MDNHFFFLNQKSLDVMNLKILNMNMKYIRIEQFLKEVVLGFIFVSNIYDMQKEIFHEDRS